MLVSILKYRTPNKAGYLGFFVLMIPVK